MVIIKPYQTAISLFHKDGSVTLFKSLAHAKKELGMRWISDNVGPHFREFSHVEWPSLPAPERRAVYTEYAYVMRNDAGEPVTAKDFHTDTLFRKSYYYRYRHALLTWDGFGPVPYTAKSKAGRHYFRSIRTFRSIRESIPLVPEDEVPPRGKQSRRNIPDRWDDYFISAREDRSWKRYRKTQYKGGSE